MCAPHGRTTGIIVGIIVRGTRPGAQAHRERVTATPRIDMAERDRHPHPGLARRRARRRRAETGNDVPRGKVKFYDADKGFGFVTDDDGGSVYVHASVLPAGTETLRPGTRVEFDVAEGRRGPQALSIHLVDPAPSVLRARRKPPEDMAVLVEDLIRLLDSASNGLRRGRYPDRSHAEKIATVLRAVADDFEA